MLNLLSFGYSLTRITHNAVQSSWEPGTILLVRWCSYWCFQFHKKKFKRLYLTRSNITVQNLASHMCPEQSSNHRKVKVWPQVFGTNSLKYNVHHQNTARYYVMYLCPRRYLCGFKTKVYWPNTEVYWMSLENRSRKPAKGQIICQRTDYLSIYRFTDLLNDKLKLSELNVCWEKCTNCDFRI